MKSRWISLTLGIILTIAGLLKNQSSLVLMTFLLGMISGLLIDLIGVGKLGLWSYSRQPFLKKKYFAFVVPAWGIFGMLINLTWNWFVHSTIWEHLLFFLAITTVLLILYEVPNLKIKSWQYCTSKWLVILGWFPLILFFRALFIAFNFA